MPNQVDPYYAQHRPVPPTNLYVGGGVWTTAPAVLSSGVYVTTGSTYDDTNAAHPPLDNNNFDQYSMIKLDPTTLAKTGKFAAPKPANVGDPDWASGAVMFRAPSAGPARRWPAPATRTATSTRSEPTP